MNKLTSLHFTSLHFTFFLSYCHSHKGDPGSDDANEFKLNEDHIEAILGKVPHGTRVAVLSIVGAFRTGKSFLLNLILRFLRHAKYGDLSEEWMQADGASLSEGCGNAVKGADGEVAAKAADELHSFVWKGTDLISLYCRDFLPTIYSSDYDRFYLIH